MNVTDHWLDGAKRLPYPAGPEMAVRRFGIAHFTQGATALSSVEFWRTSKAKGAEAHVIIDRDGTVYQIRPFNQECDHAGQSTWRCPRSGRRFTWLNRCSIGVEFANAGNDEPGLDAFDWARKQPGFRSISARHKNGGPLQNWEVYPEVQIEAGIAVFQAIVNRYNLDDLVGHDDIAPARKVDPGPAFPMKRLREACGFVGMPRR
jgi:N-acetylmuramoyl-L-alanine amidase